MVGVDRTDGLMYSRVRFFGEFERAMAFDWAPGDASGQVSYHINSLTPAAKDSMVIERTATPPARPR